MKMLYFLSLFEGVIPTSKVCQKIDLSEFLSGAVLMECLPGELLQTLNEELAYEIGTILATIHMKRTSGYGDLGHTLSHDPRVPFVAKFEEGFEECSQHLPASLLKSCRHYLDIHIDRLLSSDGPCIVHRDFRPGNIIVNKEKVQGVIDWSSARASFAEEDFCPIEIGEWPFSEESKAAF